MITTEYYDRGLILETADVILRPLKTEDQEAIFNNINHDRRVLEYYLDRYCEKPEDVDLARQVQTFEKIGYYNFAIVLKETGEVIGRIHQCSKPNMYANSIEIGYALGYRYWNKGYCSQALKAVIDLLFEKGIHKIICGCITENIASRRVMEKCGMVYEGTRKDDLFYHDRYWDVMYYYLINNK